MLEKSSLWTLRAWPHLQEDILLAVNWLITITGEPFEKYAAKWRTSTMGSMNWATLDEVLPYHYVKHQEEFIQLVPKYLESFNNLHENKILFNKNTLPQLVRDLNEKNYPFAGFLAAFYELHSHLNYLSFDKHGLDFREHRPLDYYALLAIHAEGCLRRELDSLNLLGQIKVEKQTLHKYIEKLAEKRKVSTKVLKSFNENLKLTKLFTNRIDPIGQIQSIRTSGLSQKEYMLTQAFLCCVLARNYFAHHDFLDHELIKSEKSAFLLRGILLTILILLAPSE